MCVVLSFCQRTVRELAGGFHFLEGNHFLIGTIHCQPKMMHCLHTEMYAAVCGLLWVEIIGI